MSEDPARLVLWQAGDGGRHLGETIGVVFGCGCLAVLLVLVFRRIGLSWASVAPAVLFALVLAGRATGTLRGRVALSPDGIEVRRLLTRRYRWASLRSVQLDEGQIEITPNGWVRHLPIPTSQAPEALVIITEWRSRYAPPAGRSREETDDEHGNP